eukprot:XP_027322154.1 uncharacterized protein LOC106015065 [Anas platyrhynchos]
MEKLRKMEANFPFGLAAASLTCGRGVPGRRAPAGRAPGGRRWPCRAEAAASRSRAGPCGCRCVYTATAAAAATATAAAAGARRSAGAQQPVAISRLPTCCTAPRDPDGSGAAAHAQPRPGEEEEGAAGGRQRRAGREGGERAVGTGMGTGPARLGSCPPAAEDRGCLKERLWAGPGPESKVVDDLRTASGAGVEAARFHKSSFCGTLAEQQAETRRFECNFQQLRPALLSKTSKSYAAGVLPCVRTHTQGSGHAWNSVS